MSQGRGEGPGRVTHRRGSHTWGDGGSLGGGLFAGGRGAQISATQVVKVVGQRAKGCHPAPSRLAHGGAGHTGTAQLPSHCRKECTTLTTEFSSRRLGLMRSSWEPLPHPHGASGLVSRKGSPHPAAALLCVGGGHTPGSRGPQPGGADCPHPYPRGPATGHLTPQLWTEPPSMQGRERPHTRALHPPEALQDPTSDLALANAPVQGHQGWLTPLPGTPARRPSWGVPLPSPSPASSLPLRRSKDTGLLTSTGFHLHLPSPDPSPEHALLPPDSPPRISKSVL